MGEHSKSSPGEACGTPAPQWGAGLDTFLAQVSQQVRAETAARSIPRMRAREYVTTHNPTFEHAVCTITTACRGVALQVAALQYDVTKLKHHVGGDWPDFSPDAAFATTLVRYTCRRHVQCTAFASRVAWLPSKSCQIAAVAAEAHKGVDPDANALLCECRSKRLLTQGRRRATSRS